MSPTEMMLAAWNEYLLTGNETARDAALQLAQGNSHRIGEVRMKAMIDTFRDEASLQPVWRLVPHVLDRVEGRLVERRLGVEAELLAAISSALEA